MEGNNNGFYATRLITLYAIVNARINECDISDNMALAAKNGFLPSRGMILFEEDTRNSIKSGAQPSLSIRGNSDFSVVAMINVELLAHLEGQPSQFSVEELLLLHSLHLNAHKHVYEEAWYVNNDLELLGVTDYSDWLVRKEINGIYNNQILQMLGKEKLLPMN